jgi:hypothetical protein
VRRRNIPRYNISQTLRLLGLSKLWVIMPAREDSRDEEAAKISGFAGDCRRDGRL